jgi:hypothetical protein
MNKVSETYQLSPGPATISMPALLGLYHEDINDAAAYVDIVGPAVPTTLQRTSSSLAIWDSA